MQDLENRPHRLTLQSKGNGSRIPARLVDEVDISLDSPSSTCYDRVVEKMRFTLDQLHFAEEMAFPEDIKRVFDEVFDADDALCFYIEFMRNWSPTSKCEQCRTRPLLQLIFKYSRADYENGLGPKFDQVISKLIGNREPLSN